MIKQFSAGDITVRPFKTFKNWTIQNIDQNGVDSFGNSTYSEKAIEINEGIKLDTPFSFCDPINPSGKYKRSVFQMTDAMFYKNKDNPVELFGVESFGVDIVTGRKEVRNLNDKAITATIGTRFWGEKIRPNTVSIIDNSNVHSTFHILDDGMTNLYITGSHFSEMSLLPAIQGLPPITYWDTSSGQFSYTRPNGVIELLDTAQAKEYMNMGLTVVYVEGSSSWKSDQSSSRDYFDSSNEHFGESVSVWQQYVAVGSPMDSYSLSSEKLGYAALFKYDTNQNKHRLMKKFYSPWTQNGMSQEFGSDNSILTLLETFGFQSLEQGSPREDGFGTSVSVADQFLAIGSPLASVCTGSRDGFVYVYDKNKGGLDNWGIINILQGASENDLFGTSVSMDNGILAIGAPGVSGSVGAVYIFRKRRYVDGTCYNMNTSSFWQQIKLENDSCIDIITEPINGTSSLIYSERPTPTFVSGNYTWEFETCLTSSVSLGGDNFGWCLEVSNDKLVVGCKSAVRNGFATLFTCSYTSASIGACPTASWGEYSVYRADETDGDLSFSPIYATEVSLTYDGYGQSVALNGNNMAIGCYYDKAFKSYPLAPDSTAKIYGAVYFYKYQYDQLCNNLQYHLIQKTFGNQEYIDNNNFGRCVKIEADRAAVSSEADSIFKSVQFISSSFILENQLYQSSGSEDDVLGRVALYSFGVLEENWVRDGEVRMNKEQGKPYNAFGKSIGLSTDFLVVGMPIYNVADTSSFSGSYSPILDQNVQISSSLSSQYSGSVMVYDFETYEQSPFVGNIFYKNGYITFTNTSSNYYGIMTNSGSRGFQIKYQGTHTIFEHEYLISVKPGEFNYSTNPTSLVQDPFEFDVNKDGIFDMTDLDLIMRFLNKRRFQEEAIFFDNGLTLETDTLNDDSWWGNDILLTESEDVLLLESEYMAFLESNSFTMFTKKMFDYIQANLIDTGILDIDGDGKIDMKDGALLVAYFTNKLTPSLLQSYINDKSTRRYVNDVITYLDRYCGKNKFDINPNFHEYQSSSSYDLTGSFLAPVITTIGLYDSNQLVAIAKLGRPIKNMIDWPVNIVARFDT